MSNEIKKIKSKFDWDKNFAMLEEVQKDGKWVKAPHNNEIGEWLRHCRMRREALKSEHYDRLIKMGF